MMTKQEYNKLKESGMMWELYPECTGDYETDKKIIEVGTTPVLGDGIVSQVENLNPPKYSEEFTEQDIIGVVNKTFNEKKSPLIIESLGDGLFKIKVGSYHLICNKKFVKDFKQKLNKK
jgi:hypothetical protein